jgi:hypothetical protein
MSLPVRNSRYRYVRSRFGRVCCSITTLARCVSDRQFADRFSNDRTYGSVPAAVRTRACTFFIRLHSRNMACRPAQQADRPRTARRSALPDAELEARTLRRPGASAGYSDRPSFPRGRVRLPTRGAIPRKYCEIRVGHRPGEIWEEERWMPFEEQGGWEMKGFVCSCSYATSAAGVVTRVGREYEQMEGRRRRCRG